MQWKSSSGDEAQDQVEDCWCSAHMCNSPGDILPWPGGAVDGPLRRLCLSPSTDRQVVCGAILIARRASIKVRVYSLPKNGKSHNARESPKIPVLHRCFCKKLLRIGIRPIGS